MTETRLSTRAQRLLERLREGAFYQTFGSRVPATMQELIDAGLVSTAGRVSQIVSCYVPSTGYTPYQPEVFDRATMLDEPPPRVGGVDLRDPVAVHLNMLRGSIARPSMEQIIHLYGREAIQAALNPRADGRPPIPEDVYFSAESLNFYSMQGNQGMGNEFFAMWYPRAAEFPQAGEDGPGEDEE